jgi:hypothetical protein
MADYFDFWQVGNVTDAPGMDKDDEMFPNGVSHASETYSPFGSTLTLGAAAAAAAQGQPAPTGELTILSTQSPSLLSQAPVSPWAPLPASASPQPALRRFGSMGNGTFFSSAERSKAQAQARVENQSLQSVVNELCTMAQLGSKIRADVLSGTVPRGLYNSWVQQCLPDKKFMAGWKRKMLVNFSIEQRQSPDDFDHWTQPMQDAISSYVGLYYTNSQMLEVPRDARMVLMPVYGTGESSKEVLYWVDPTHNVDQVDRQYDLDDDVYGTQLNIDMEIKYMEEQWKNAIDATLLLSTRLSSDSASKFVRQQPIRKMADGGHRSEIVPCGPEVPMHRISRMGGSTEPSHMTRAYADSREHLVDTLREMMNPTAGSAQVIVDKAKSLRSLVLRRATCAIKMNQSKKTVEDHAIAAIARRREFGAEQISNGFASASMMMNSFTDVDSWQGIIDFLDPPAAACFLRVYIGASDRDPVTKKLVPDGQITAQLRGRFPHLHVYTVPGCFPHRVEGSECHIFADRYMELCIGFVQSRPRSLIAAERLASGYVPPLTAAETREDAAKVAAGNTEDFVRNERHTKLVAEGHDFGRDKDEEKIRVIRADMGARLYNAELPRRRVLNDGWHVHTTVVNDNIQYSTVRDDSIFEGRLDMKLQLVHDEDGSLVSDVAPDFGLEPDKWLKEVDSVPLITRMPSARTPHVPNPKYLEILELTGNIGTLVRVRPTALASAHQSGRFRVVVIAKGTHRRTGHPVELRASSQPIVVKSDKRTESTIVGGGTGRKKCKV